MFRNSHLPVVHFPRFYFVAVSFLLRQFQNLKFPASRNFNVQNTVLISWFYRIPNFNVSIFAILTCFQLSNLQLCTFPNFRFLGIPISLNPFLNMFDSLLIIAFVRILLGAIVCTIGILRVKKRHQENSKKTLSLDKNRGGGTKKTVRKVQKNSFQ